MYRINILSDGTHHNVCTGIRYCFGKKTALNTAIFFGESGCALKIERLLHVGGLFFWSDDALDTRIIEEWDGHNYTYRLLNKNEYL